MKTRIIRIGNSRGIRIPKPLLAQFDLNAEVDLTAVNGTLVIQPTTKPRAGWAAAFREMARRGDDLVVDDLPQTSSWDSEEWEWQ